MDALHHDSDAQNKVEGGCKQFQTSSIWESFLDDLSELHQSTQLLFALNTTLVVPKNKVLRPTRVIDLLTMEPCAAVKKALS